MRNLILLVLSMGLIFALGCSPSPSPVASNSGNSNSNTSSSKPKLAPLNVSGGGGNNESKEEADDEKEKAEEEKEEKANSADLESKTGGEDGRAEASMLSSGAGDAGVARKKPKKSSGSSGGRRRPQLAPLNIAGGGGSGKGQTVNPSENKNNDDEEEDDQKEEDTLVSKKQNNSDTSNGDDEEEVERSLYDLAQIAFALEFEESAMNFLYAHALTDESVLSKHGINWYSALKEPRVALRWGVGVHYTTTGDVEGAPPVIGGDPEDFEGTTSSGSGAENSRGTSSNLNALQGPSSKRKEKKEREKRANRGGKSGLDLPPREKLIYYTGDFGEFLLERLEMRRTRNTGYYGYILSDIDVENVDFDAEEFVEVDDSGSSNRNDTGDGGNRAQASLLSDGGGASEPEPVRNNNRNNNNGSKRRSYGADNSKKTSLQPGVMMVGVDNTDKLLRRANDLGLDVLVVFEVKVRKSSTTDKISNSTRLNLYLVKDGQELIKGKTLTMASVAKKRESMRGDDDDPVQVALDSVFQEFADENLRAADMPSNIEKEHIDKRVSKIVSASPKNPLPALVEIMAYKHMGYLEESEVMTAFEELIGKKNAVNLIEGDDDEKRKALSDWLPKDMSQTSAKSGGDGGSFR